jgi:hypothetical protein
MGVSPELRARILNHVSGRRASITEGVYNVHQYDGEKRTALETWAAKLNRIVANRTSSAHVVAFKKEPRQ